MHWMILPFQRYFDFSGRSRRMEYWMFTVLWTVVTIVLFLPFLVELISSFGDADRFAGTTPEPFDGISTISWVALVLWIIFVLGAFIPSLAVSVRRFHDVGMSGWVYVGLYVANMILGIVFIAILIITLLPSVEGTNKWGPNPKNPYPDDADVFD